MFDIFYIGRKPNLFPHEQQVDSIEHAQKLSRTRYCWIVNYLADYAGFDFLWEPVPWQSHQRHAWASQWQKDSGTYLVPKTGYTDTNYHSEQIAMTADLLLWQNINSVETFDFSWHPDFSDPPFNYEFGTQWQKTGGPKYILGNYDTKYLSQSNSKVRALATHAVLIDHLNKYNLELNIPIDRTVRYFDNYKDTLTRIARTCEHEYVWVVSTVCDYKNFDFTWHPEIWQNNMLHVFSSDGEKFGDTFFMHVPSFRSKIDQFELLEWYDLNFVGIDVPRKPMPVIKHQFDSQADAVNSQNFMGPLALFTNTDYVDRNLVTVPLWRAETKVIVPLSKGASTVVVPQTAVSSIRTQLYDYPQIDKTQTCLQDPPLDIVFISNGEPGAEYNFKWLETVTRANMNSNLNRIHWSKNVPGRVAAYHAAAEMSTTPWFFAVFAKLRVNRDFDWTWQPDRMQQAKHYIFHARNTINDLEYGHQGMIAYNRQLVLKNTGAGLDFTLDQPHEVVPILSGEAIYYDSAWIAWRTAFRECLKLRASLPDVENEYRLKQWLSVDHGPGQWSKKGAEDAVEYYDEVGGDFGALKKSYEWSWLSTYAFVKRSLTTDQ
jgi:hypothetical protein